MTGPGLNFSIVVRPGHPDFLDLPWRRPLTEWRSGRLVEVDRGIHRHVVRFVDYGGRLYALKELPQRLAEREYRLLRSLEEKSIPAVEAIGVASRSRPARSSRPSRTPEPDAILITRHLEFSVPCRMLFAEPPVTDVRNRLLDALAGLLVRLHLAGFFWGDCSLSNALFRRDAGCAGEDHGEEQRRTARARTTQNTLRHKASVRLCEGGSRAETGAANRRLELRGSGLA